jgi:hypothetical protein
VLPGRGPALPPGRSPRPAPWPSYLAVPRASGVPSLCQMTAVTNVSCKDTQSSSIMGLLLGANPPSPLEPYEGPASPPPVLRRVYAPSSGRQALASKLPAAKQLRSQRCEQGRSDPFPRGASGRPRSNAPLGFPQTICSRRHRQVAKFAAEQALRGSRLPRIPAPARQPVFGGTRRRVRAS